MNKTTAKALEQSIKHWERMRDGKAYLRGHKESRDIFLTIFSPDEKYVLSSAREISRHNEKLIQVVEMMGDKANGDCASLKIVEIPDGTDYEISEYDGMEHIAEKHQTWG